MASSYLIKYVLHHSQYVHSASQSTVNVFTFKILATKIPRYYRCLPLTFFSHNFFTKKPTTKVTKLHIKFFRYSPCSFLSQIIRFSTFHDHLLSITYVAHSCFTVSLQAISITPIPAMCFISSISFYMTYIPYIWTYTNG